MLQLHLSDQQVYCLLRHDLIKGLTVPKAIHYIDVMMTTMASQITSFTVVYSIVYSGADKKKHQSSASLAFVREFTGTSEFPAERASNAENVSI